MQQPSDEIKSRLDIVEVLREYISLKPAGINFRALCPFHREKTPSFMVSPEKQIWHCFGCGKGGDIFSFVMEIDGLSFVEALRLLAPKAGVTLKQQDPKIASQRNRLLDIIETSRNYYYQNLMESPQAEEMRDYLSERGIIVETIEDWQIGYALDSWDDLLIKLKGKNFNNNEIFLAGMSIKKEGTNRMYNRFRNRIIFPINDVNGNTVAFSARINPSAEEAEKMGKYINSPQTLIYDKSRILFGLDKAKQAIRNEDLAIIVEGQTDVITAHQNGFKNVIATSGTALTRDQIVLLKRYTNNISLAFDMDEAGQIAADRGIREAMRAEMNIKVITMPKGLDPDEYIKDNPDEWRQSIKKAKPMMEYFTDKVLASLNIEKVEDKRLAVKKILPMISSLGNTIEQDHWLKKLSQEIEVKENLLRETLKSSQAKDRESIRKEDVVATGTTKDKGSREAMLAELLLAIIIKFPRLIEHVLNHISIDQIEGENNKFIYKNLILYYNKGSDNSFRTERANGHHHFNYYELKEWLENSSLEDGAGSDDNKFINNQLKVLDRLVLLGDRDFYNIDEQQAKSELVKIILEIKRYYLKSRMKETEKLIAQSEKDKEYEKVRALMEELKLLTDEMREIEIS